MLMPGEISREYQEGVKGELGLMSVMALLCGRPGGTQGLPDLNEAKNSHLGIRQKLNYLNGEHD